VLGLLLVAFQAIPDDIWEQTHALSPTDGDTPFIDG